MLLIILSCIYIISAKVIPNDIQSLEYEGDDIDKDRRNYRPIGYFIGDPLWVLRLYNDDWLDPKLRLGSFEEVKDFYAAAGPAIRRALIHRQFSRMKKNDPKPIETITEPPNNQTTRSNRAIRTDILKMLNKFVLSTSIQPYSYVIQETDERGSNDPSIVIYFKGPLTCLIIKYGRSRWNYMIETRPFPAWFSEQHNTFDAPIKVPENLTNRFFSSLLDILEFLLDQ
ncbi:uncharacterized protein LOC142982802 [Anticarsia gemmatalis]|uniref:uncharacterized protein LOC142982802 n=1 Tax=Anticarsia gemmatalis TaxID=129554 RepID=UPI003F76D519